MTWRTRAGRMGRLLAFLAPSALSAQPAPAAPPAPDPPSRLTVRLDSARHEIVLTAGPFRVVAMPPMNHDMMGSEMEEQMYTPVERFVWPVDGWFRGYRLELTDGRGRRLPQRLLHHLIAVNFSRRMLLYSSVERLFGVAAESGEEGLMAPKWIGVPMTRGQEIGIYAMWHNEGAEDIPEAYWRLVLKWSPRNLHPAPVSVLPFYADVNLRVADDNRFDVPPGKSSQSHEFTMPVSGRLLVVGGHMHDYGVAVRLEDALTGRKLVTVKAKRDREGKLVGMPLKLLAIRTDGLRLKAGRRYRVVALYDNPTPETLYGAMGHMAGIIAPDDWRRWPALDPRDPTLQKDLAELRGGAP